MAIGGTVSSLCVYTHAPTAGQNDPCSYRLILIKPRRFSGLIRIHRYLVRLNISASFSRWYQRYDYTSPGGYFVTICTKDRMHYFGEIVDGEMRLNTLGQICKQHIQQIDTRKNVQIHEYVVMPNHVHIIVIISEFTNPMNT